MFNFKKKLSLVANSVKHSFELIRDPQEVIAEIHESFDSASEKLLKEAKNILSSKHNIDKGVRLREVGFIMAKKAVEASSVRQKIADSEELANQIEYYQTHYPNNKFITEDKVMQICKKYGLLFGETRYYISDVPEKNLTEIENFKLRQDENEKYTYTSKDMRICASVKDFDTRDMRIENGYKLELNIPDPIVLQPVKGGYLIVSKWGLEGQDESLVNEKMN